MSFELPELDRKATQSKVEEHLERYRLFKYLTFEEREASITASSEVRYHGPTNDISDQTSNIAIYNVDEKIKRERFCERVEWAVRGLSKMEAFLITERYMSRDSDYMSDYMVYNFKFQPPISIKKYSRIRWSAFYKLSLRLNIAVVKPIE